MILRKRIKTEEDRAKEVAKARAKQRKKMLRTKYGQTPLRHARKGVYSCIYGGVVLVLVLLMLIISFLAKGEISVIFGLIGLGTLVLSGMGLYLGIKGLRERNKNYITCKVGIGINGVFLLGMAAIFIRGLL